jgi:hypothetical protein
LVHGEDALRLNATVPRAEYDPVMRTLRQRELAKVDELAVSGHLVALSTLQRLRLAYEGQITGDLV